MKVTCLAGMSLLLLVMPPLIAQTSKCECTMYPWRPLCNAVCPAKLFNKASSDDMTKKLGLSSDVAQEIISARNRRQFSTTTDVRHAVLSGASKRDLTETFKLNPSTAAAVVNSQDRQPTATDSAVGNDQLGKIDATIVVLAEALVRQAPLAASRFELRNSGGNVIASVSGGGIVVEPSARIEQHSEGPNSPNVIGDNNHIIINPGPKPASLTYFTKPPFIDAGKQFVTQAEIYTDAAISRPMFVLFCDQPMMNVAITNRFGMTSTPEVTGSALHFARGSEEEVHKFVRMFGVGLPDPVRPGDDIVLQIQTCKPLKCLMIMQLVAGPPNEVAVLPRTPGSSSDACADYIAAPNKYLLPREEK